MKNENKPSQPVRNPNQNPPQKPTSQPPRPQAPPDRIEIHSDPNIPRPTPHPSPNRK